MKRKKQKKHVIFMYVEVFLTTNVKGKSGNLELLKEFDGFQFLPPPGTVILGLEGLDEWSHSLFVSKEKPQLSETEDAFHWCLNLQAKGLPKDRCPEISAREYKEAIRAGWTTV